MLRYSSPPQENHFESPVARFSGGSDWGSPPAFPIAEATPLRKALARSVSLQNATPPPPLPRADDPLCSPSGQKPDWQRVSSAVRGPPPATCFFSATPLPQRRLSHLSPQGITPGGAVAASPTPGQEKLLTDADWETFYATQRSVGFVTATPGSATQPPRGQAGALSSPPPRSIHDIPDLPPMVDYDPMTADVPPAAIGVRPGRALRPALDASAASNESGTVAGGALAARAAVVPRTEARLASIDAVLDRLQWRESAIAALPPVGDDRTPGSTDLSSHSPCTSRRRDRSFAAADEACAVTMSAVDGIHADATSPSPARGHPPVGRRTRRVVAIAGALGLLATAATFTGLGAAGLLG